MLKKEEFQAAVDYLTAHLTLRPQIGIILGSGLGILADDINESQVIPYADIPGWPQGSVIGHAGRLIVGHLEDQPVLVMQGRTHFYEGQGMAAVAFPIRVMAGLGIHTLIVTNAAGGINPTFKAGDLMLIKDQINIPAMAGLNPLIGPNDDDLGPRFPPMTTPYSRGLRTKAKETAAALGIPLQEGVYMGLAGPAFETPAEALMIRLLGADAVGMSTVSEVMVARHAGLNVLGFSGISNVVIDDVDSDAPVSHEEVLVAGIALAPKLIAILRGVLRDI